MEGVIFKIQSNLYTVRHKNSYFLCHQTGLVRFQNVEPVIGDRVNFSKNQFGEYQITALLPRTNALVRPKVANVDQLLIVMSVSRPQFNNLRVMQYMVLAYQNNINPVVIFTKRDLIQENPEVKKWYRIYKKMGYPVLFISNKKHKWFFMLKMRGLIYHKLSVLTGPSGVGKSTIINSLFKTNQAKTDVLQVKRNWGRQTTRHNQIYMWQNKFIADTPGFSSFSLQHFSPQQVANSFSIFTKHARQCAFNNCLHQQEEQCKIKSMVKQGKIPSAFYQDYTKLVNDVFKRK